MPKGKRFDTLPLDEQISMLESKIVEAQNNLDTMKSKLENLKTLKDKEDLETLLAAIRLSGKTVNEVLAMIGQTA
jgi:flagellar biosynthesis chaperone FliJ